LFIVQFKLMKDYLEKNKEEFKRWITDGEQGRIEIKILPYLKDIEKGFFIEAGALDGLFMSNTKILEDLGWNGLLIEPSKKAFDKCLKNRRVPVENCALVSKDYEGSQVIGDFFFDGEDGLGAWSGIHRNLYGIKAAVPTPAKTLESILVKHGISKVDFFSLDVEGYELEVLKGIDLNNFEITYILIEVNLSEYTLKEIEDYLSLFGYKNIACLSGFSIEMHGYDGSHNDYLFKKTK